MRYYHILEHRQGGVNFSRPKIDDSFTFEGVFDDYDIYKKETHSDELYIASNSNKDTLGFVVVEKRGGEYFSVRNMMAYTKGAVRVLIECLLSKRYKLLSDDIMTPDGEKFFLSYSKVGRLKTVNMSTNHEELWNDNMTGTDKDPRTDTSVKDALDKHSVYWLIEQRSVIQSKYGSKNNCVSSLRQRLVDIQLDENTVLEIDDF